MQTSYPHAKVCFNVTIVTLKQDSITLFLFVLTMNKYLLIEKYPTGQILVQVQHQIHNGISTSEQLQWKVL